MEAQTRGESVSVQGIVAKMNSAWNWKNLYMKPLVLNSCFPHSRNAAVIPCKVFVGSQVAFVLCGFHMRSSMHVFMFPDTSS